MSLLIIKFKTFLSNRVISRNRGKEIKNSVKKTNPFPDIIKIMSLLIHSQNLGFDVISTIDMLAMCAFSNINET